MHSTQQHTRAGLDRFPAWSIAAYVVVISIAVDAALLVSVMANLNWVYAAIWGCSAALVSGGVLFTVLEVSKANDRS